MSPEATILVAFGTISISGLFAICIAAFAVYAARRA